MAVTASTVPGDRERCRAAGMDDIVYKPFRPEEIFGCLERQLGVRFLRQQAPSPAPESGETLDRAVLAALPEDLRRELADALVALDTTRIAALIGRVAERDAALGQCLRRHADNFDYDPIMKALAPDEDASQAR